MSSKETPEEKFRRMKMPEYVFAHEVTQHPCELCSVLTEKFIMYRDFWFCEETKSKLDEINTMTKQTDHERCACWNDYAVNFEMALCDKHIDEWFDSQGWVKREDGSGHVRKN